MNYIEYFWHYNESYTGQQTFGCVFCGFLLGTLKMCLFFCLEETLYTLIYSLIERQNTFITQCFLAFRNANLGIIEWFGVLQSVNFSYCCWPCLIAGLMQIILFLPFSYQKLDPLFTWDYLDFFPSLCCSTVLIILKVLLLNYFSLGDFIKNF